MKTSSYNELEYYEFDEIVNKYFNSDGWYEFVGAEEANNDSSYTFSNVTKERYIKEKESGIVDVWDNISKKHIPLREAFNKKIWPMYAADRIFLELIYNNILPEGNYIINVGW